MRLLQSYYVVVVIVILLCTHMVERLLRSTKQGAFQLGFDCGTYCGLRSCSGGSYRAAHRNILRYQCTEFDEYY